MRPENDRASSRDRHAVFLRAICIAVHWWCKRGAESGHLPVRPRRGRGGPCTVRVIPLPSSPCCWQARLGCRASIPVWGQVASGTAPSGTQRRVRRDRGLSLGTGGRRLARPRARGLPGARARACLCCSLRAHLLPLGRCAGIDCYFDTPITAVDIAGKKLTADDGTEFHCDNLVLSTGARVRGGRWGWDAAGL